MTVYCCELAIGKCYAIEKLKSPESVTHSKKNRYLKLKLERWFYFILFVVNKIFILIVVVNTKELQ